MKYVTQGTEIVLFEQETHKKLLETHVEEIESDRLFLYLEDGCLEQPIEEGDEISCKISTIFGMKDFDSIILDLAIPNRIVIEHNTNDYKVFDKREFLRVNVHVKGIICHDNKFYNISTIDLGGGGSKFYSEVELPVNEKVELKIKLFENDTFISIWGTIYKYNYCKEHEYVIQFQSISEHIRSKIMKKCFEVQSLNIRDVMNKNDSNN